MKNLRNYVQFLFYFIVLFGVTKELLSQEIITKKQAWEIVKKKVLNDNLENINVYVSKTEIKENFQIKSIFTEVISPPFQSWFFFIDDIPLANWGHPCRYVFINKDTGEILVKDNIYPPSLKNMEPLLKMKIKERGKLFDFKKKNEGTKNVCSPDNEYAVIISGGADYENNFERYWNDCAAVYSALVEVYGYHDDHIYVLISDGTNSANDRHLIGGSYDSSPLDLDDDGDDDTEYSATRANITTVFTELGNIMDTDDNLFIFVTDHGGYTSGQDVILNLWGQTIRDDQFATEVDRVDAGRINIVMEQCYSGGFIDDLEDNNRVIATACRYNEPSYARSDLTYDEFAYHWISAVAGETPGGTPVDADYNNDDYVSMYEAFIYALAHDSKTEHPQYNSTPSDMGEFLDLIGRIPHITGDYVICYTPNETYTLHDRPPGSSVNWTRSSNLSYIGGQGTNYYTVRANSSSVHAGGWVQAYITTINCDPITVRYNLWVGKFESTVVTGQAAVCPDELYTYTAQVPGGHSSSYNYDWTYPGNWIWQAEMNNWIRLKTPMYNPQYGTVRVRIANACGTSGYSGITVYPGYNCGGYYMAFPNPGSSYVDIDINPKMSTSMEEIYNNDISLSLYNKMGTVVLNSNVESLPYRIDTSELSNGEYVVKIITRKKDGTEKDQRVESLKITVNH